MDPRERLMNALLLKCVDRKPIVPFTQTGTLELMDACGSRWPAAHREPALMARLSMAAFNIGGFEGVRVPFGLYAESGALGCEIDYVEAGNKPPIVRKLPSLDSLKRDADPLSSNTTRVVIQAVKALQALNRPEVPIIVGVQGPFTLVGNLMGMSQMLLLSIKSPERLDELLEVTSGFVGAYIAELVGAGADVISLCDAMASGEFLGPTRFERSAFPYLKRVIQPCKVPLVLHMCHNCAPLVPLLVKTGAKAIGVDQKVDIRRVKESTQQAVSVVGNINPVDIMVRKPEELGQIARGVIEAGVDVVAPGCGLLAPTPTANIVALTRAVKEYRPGGG